MLHWAARNSQFAKKLATVAAILAFANLAVLFDSPLNAQSAASQAAAVRPPTPQWQIDAGGHLEFDVASVKQNTAAPNDRNVSSNIPLGPMDMFSPTGGLLSATNTPLTQYMEFAYKLTNEQWDSVQSQLPKWATTNRYDIQARVQGNPTKDQFRLMMQALLADRFKLALHYETKQVSVFSLVLDKPGKLGPHLQQHPSDLPCSTAQPPPGPPTFGAAGFPETCGVLVGYLSKTPGQLHFGGRNVPMAMIANYIIGGPNGVDRPVLDRTGLTGKFDFSIEFTPQFNGPLPPGFDFKPDETGPTFLEAIKEQLGLKLEATKGPVDVIVIDHVEPPSEN